MHTMQKLIACAQAQASINQMDMAIFEAEQFLKETEQDINRLLAMREKMIGMLAMAKVMRHSMAKEIKVYDDVN